MTTLPIHDRAGNALVDFRLVEEHDLPRLAERVPLPASLVVVRHAGAVLMIFDSWRRYWELPGGMREPGETPREAAIRELREETGIDKTDLTFVAVAEFVLTAPARRELLAVYAVRLHEAPSLTTNEEALAFRWYKPTQPVSDDMSPLDAEIATRTCQAGNQPGSPRGTIT